MIPYPETLECRRYREKLLFEQCSLERTTSSVVAAKQRADIRKSESVAAMPQASREIALSSNVLLENRKQCCREAEHEKQR